MTPKIKMTPNIYLRLLGFLTLSIIWYSKEHNGLETGSVSETLRFFSIPGDEHSPKTQ
jgi:hypothetical protein